MTFSLHKSTAMTDMQAAGQKPQPLGVNDDATADMSNDAELNTSENSFSQLFSLFSNDNKTETSVDNKALSTASESTTKLGGEVVTLDAVDEMIIDDELSVSKQDGRDSQGEPLVESSDDFLARLDQSSMLLQGNVATEPKTSFQDAANGNKLPVDAEETNIASTVFGGMKAMPKTTELGVDKREISSLEIKNVESNNLDADGRVSPEYISNNATTEPNLVNHDLAESDIVSGNDLTQVLQTGDSFTEPTNAAAALTLAGISDMTNMADNKASLSKDHSVDGENKLSFAASLGEPSMTKNTPFGQVNGMAANIADPANGVVDTNSASDLQVTNSAEPIEQLDFAQIMESARKQEPVEQLARTAVKAPVLTDAEQQVLDKRVHLNNTLASSELNEKIAIMAGKELQTATIRLDPAELGSMNIKLVVQNDQINVTIQAQNNQSRDLLEQQMPRLREMLQQQGMTLGETQVQADSGQQQSAFQQSRQENGQKNTNIVDQTRPTRCGKN